MLKGNATTQLDPKIGGPSLDSVGDGKIKSNHRHYHFVDGGVALE